MLPNSNMSHARSKLGLHGHPSCVFLIGNPVVLTSPLVASESGRLFLCNVILGKTLRSQEFSKDRHSTEVEVPDREYII
jgi:hypothetical protein